MASPTPKRAPVSNHPLEVVDPAWILKAFALTILAAVICAYLAVCLLIWQGSWQLLLHPSAKVDRTPSIPFQLVHFDAGATGTPRLTGWWIPATSVPDNAPTLLFLHDGTGNLSNTVDKLTLLHNSAVNIFAIDYRGFGQSDPTHPNETRMAEDAAAALDYLLNTRHIPAIRIIPYGQTLAVSLAENLALTHPDLPAIILDNPDLTAAQRQFDASRTRLLPMRLLVRDRFDPRPPMAALKLPKLLIAGGPGNPPVAFFSPQEFFRSASAPKRSVFLPANNADALFTEALNRFLQEYLPAESLAAFTR